MIGLNLDPLILDKSVKGSINNINNEPNIAITPRSLLGIDLNIAQNGNRSLTYIYLNLSEFIL